MLLCMAQQVVFWTSAVIRELIKLFILEGLTVAKKNWPGCSAEDIWKISGVQLEEQLKAYQAELEKLRKESDDWKGKYIARDALVQKLETELKN